MTPVGRLEAAIKKLESLKATSTPGPWVVDEHNPAIYTLGETVVGGTVFYVNDDQQTGDHRPEGDAQLAVTLHRTIDAQLMILRGTVELHAEFVAIGKESAWLVAVERAGDLALADAILGTDS